MWTAARTKDSKKFATTTPTLPSAFLSKGFAESFHGVGQFLRHEQPVSLYGPEINLSLLQICVFQYCLTSLCVGHMDLHSVTKVLLLSPFYRWEDWGSGILRSSPKVTWLLDGKARFKPKQSGSGLYSFLCCGQWTGRENKRVTGLSKRRRKRESILRWCFPMSGWFHGKFPYWVYSIQQVRNGSLNSKGSTSMPAPIFCPVQLPRRDWDSTLSSNRHVEMDGSHISQLQLADRFGEITFPGTNWEPVLEIKGAAY